MALISHIISFIYLWQIIRLRLVWIPISHCLNHNCLHTSLSTVIGIYTFPAYHWYGISRTCYLYNIIYNNMLFVSSACACHLWVCLMVCTQQWQFNRENEVLSHHMKGFLLNHQTNQPSYHMKLVMYPLKFPLLCHRSWFNHHYTDKPWQTHTLDDLGQCFFPQTAQYTGTAFLSEAMPSSIVAE